MDSIADATVYAIAQISCREESEESDNHSALAHIMAYLSAATHWVCAAGLSLLFPIRMEHFEPGQLFGFFTFMMVLQLLWVKIFVPKTKGVPLEEMQSRLGIAEEN